ncbi:MAG: hypothetical protein OXM62_07930 [bacterium]|nr:hypothetical protein [bacterium]MDE0234923.1 hypothetical protein [bacterium]
MEETVIDGRVVNEIGAVLPNLAVGDATLEQLQARLQSTFRVESQAAAVRAQTLAELIRREGVHITENNLREKGVATPPQSPLRSGNRSRVGRTAQDIGGFAGW